VNHPIAFDLKKTRFSVAATIILTLSLIFLQEGFTYYVSFQILALVTVGLLISRTSRALKTEKHFYIALLAFTYSLMVTSVVSPAVISSNSENAFLTFVGVMGYAVMIGCVPNLKIRRPSLVLQVLKTVSSATICTLFGILVVSESGLIPALNRDAMILKNSRLIDNFTDADALSTDIAFRALIEQAGRINLFYGEPSFLAIVLFTCLGCFMITSKIMENAGNGSAYLGIKPNTKGREAIILLGVLLLLYIESFSSIIYALIIIYFAFIKRKVSREKLVATIAILAVLTAAFLAFSYQYFLFRLTQTGSLSFLQRFGFMLDISLGDLLLGIKDEALVPEVGIHNGLFYIIAIAGVGGVLYLISLLYSVFSLSKPIKWQLFSVILVLSIMMQNGGVFSPNKVVLFSLILLPLACARTIFSRRHPRAIGGRQYE